MLLALVNMIYQISWVWPYLSVALFILFFVFFIQWYFSPRRNVRVDCWFCQSKTKVPRAYSNDWMCSACNQYNGFNKDGGYSKPVPGQASNGAPIPRLCRSERSLANFSSHSDILCRSCAANQQLKIQQLARFEPINEERFDEELDAFRAKLDKSLGLCVDCNSRARSVVRNCDRRVLPKFVEWQRSKNAGSTPSPKKNVKKSQRYFSCPRLHVPSCASLLTSVELLTSSFMISAPFPGPEWRATEVSVAWGCLWLLVLRLTISLFSAKSIVVPCALLFCWAPILMLVATDFAFASATIQHQVFLLKTVTIGLFMIAVLMKKRFTSHAAVPPTDSDFLQECEAMEADEASDPSSVDMDTASPLRSEVEPPGSDSLSFRTGRAGSVMSSACYSAAPSNGFSGGPLIRPSRLSSVLSSTSAPFPQPPSESGLDYRSVLSFPPSASVMQPPSPSLSSRRRRRSSAAPSLSSLTSQPCADSSRPKWQQVLLGLGLGLNGALLFYWCILPFLGKLFTVSRP